MKQNSKWVVSFVRAFWKHFSKRNTAYGKRYQSYDGSNSLSDIHSHCYDPHCDLVGPRSSENSASDSTVRGPGFDTRFVSPCADSIRAVVSYWRKYVHEELVNRLGGLSLPRKNVVRLTNRLDMIVAVYRGCKTITHNKKSFLFYR